MQEIQAFKDHMSQKRKNVILTHFNPDADALGSSLGLSRYLRKKGHDVMVITPSEYPDFISWMPLDHEVQVFRKERPEKFMKAIAEADTIFCLDFSSLNRINDLGEMVRKSAGKKVL